MPTGDANYSGHLVPFLWDLHMLYLLRQILFPNLSLFFRTVLFEHPSVLSRFCFLERCTLTNKADGTIWRDLSNSPRRRQGPDPLWMSFGTPSAFWLEIAYSLGVTEPTLTDVIRYFWYNIFITSDFCVLIFMTLLWLVVGPRSL